MPDPARRDPSARGFGAAMLAAGALAAWRLSAAGMRLPAVCAAGVGVALLALSLAAPSRALPLARAWQRLGEAIGRVTTPALLTVVFALVVVPTRLAMALARVDPLRRRFDRAAATYWEERRDGALTREGLERPW